MVTRAAFPPATLSQPAPKSPRAEEPPEHAGPWPMQLAHTCPHHGPASARHLVSTQFAPTRYDMLDHARLRRPGPHRCQPGRSAPVRTSTPRWPRHALTRQAAPLTTPKAAPTPQSATYYTHASAGCPRRLLSSHELRPSSPPRHRCRLVFPYATHAHTHTHTEDYTYPTQVKAFNFGCELMSLLNGCCEKVKREEEGAKLCYGGGATS